MANQREVAKVIGVLTLAYTRAELKDGMLDVWSALLSDVPADVLEVAAKQLMVELTFFPSLAELRNKAFDLMLGVQNIPSAAEAWEDAKKEINRCGDYYRYTIRGTHEPKYCHSLVAKAVSILGYVNLLQSDNVAADRAHFFKVYESLISRANQDAKLLPEARAISEKYQLETGKLVKRLTA